MSELRDVMGRVDRELRALWAADPLPGEVPKTRACTTNLVVVAATAELARIWLPVVDDVLQGIPARAVVVGLDPDGDDRLEADVSAVCTPAAGGGGAVCSERVSLVAHGGVCSRVPSLAGSLCQNDVPTTLVWLGRLRADDPIFAPLAADATRIVLDAAQGSLSSLASVAYWARARARSDRPGIGDLAWTRLAPWQELCARVFDEPRARDAALRVSRCTVAQSSAAGATLGPEGALLLGWLATRLGWRASSLAGKLRITRPDGGVVAVALRAEPGAQPGGEPRETLCRVELEASGPDAAVRARIVREGEAVGWHLETTRGAEVQRLERSVPLRTRQPARLLEMTMRRPARDDALTETIAWVDELRGEELACA